MKTVYAPIEYDKQHEVRRVTARYLGLAESLFRIELPPITIRFDLTGRSAGMYCVQKGQRSIRYNPYLFAKYFEDNLATTVPHEVAHYIADMIHGFRHIRPHGPEWKEIMRALGAEPRATARYDLSGTPVRRQRRFSYRCHCGIHKLSATRHYRIYRRGASYICNRCKAELVCQESIRVTLLPFSDTWHD